MAEIADRPPFPLDRRLRRWLRTSGVRHVYASTIACFALFPVVWILSAAFNRVDDISTSRLIPSDVTLDNFRILWEESTTPVGRWMWNSFVVGIVAASANVVIAAFAAYAFSRLRFAGRRTLLTSLLVMQIFPQFLGFIALFVLAQEVGDVSSAFGLNTHLFLILVYAGGAAGFNAFLLKGFLDSIPTSLDEAAVLDGASNWVIFSRVIVPLARPMLAVVFMISFIAIFGEFILASSLLSDTDRFTLPIGLQTFLGESYNAKWGALSAVALVGALPIVVLFLVAQKHIIGGLTAGSIKG